MCNLTNEIQSQTFKGVVEKATPIYRTDDQRVGYEILFKSGNRAHYFTERALGLTRGTELRFKASKGRLDGVLIEDIIQVKKVAQERLNNKQRQVQRLTESIG